MPTVHWQNQDRLFVEMFVEEYDLIIRFAYHGAASPPIEVSRRFKNPTTRGDPYEIRLTAELQRQSKNMAEEVLRRMRQRKKPRSSQDTTGAT